MKKELFIKNMVCDRCKTTVEQLVKKNEAQVLEMQLGKVLIETNPKFDLKLFRQALNENGFELMQQPEVKLVEEIKIHLLSLLHQLQTQENVSGFLAKKLHKEYSVLSKSFKKIEGQTIEKFFIKLKIEKAKELIQMNEFSFSEIAYQLNYNSISHLSGQFKTITGMTMSEYKTSRQWNRSPLDKIL